MCWEKHGRKYENIDFADKQKAKASYNCVYFF